MPSSILQPFQAAAENTAKAVGHTLEGTTLIADTIADKGLKFTNATLEKSIETAGVAQNAANNIAQKVVITGEKGIEHAANITIEGAQSVALISKNGLNVAAEASTTTADVAKQSLSTTKDIATTGLQKLGDVTTTSLKLTGNSLVAVFGSANNVAARQVHKVEAINKADSIRATQLVYVYSTLGANILNDFDAKMIEFIKNFKDMVSNQQKLLKSILSIYKLKMCDPGYLRARCSQKISTKTAQFQKELNSLHTESLSKITILETIKTEAKNKFSSIARTSTPEAYAETLENTLVPLCSKASNIFTSTMEKFETLATSLDKAESDKNQQLDEKLQLYEKPQFTNEETQSAAAAAAGGSYRQKRCNRKYKKTKKPRKSRKSRKSRKNRKH